MVLGVLVCVIACGRRGDDVAVDGFRCGVADNDRTLVLPVAVGPMLLLMGREVDDITTFFGVEARLPAGVPVTALQGTTDALVGVLPRR